MDLIRLTERGAPPRTMDLRGMHLRVILGDFSARVFEECIKSIILDEWALL
jgi:hypothetical protein